MLATPRVSTRLVFLTLGLGGQVVAPRAGVLIVATFVCVQSIGSVCIQCQSIGSMCIQSIGSISFIIYVFIIRSEYIPFPVRPYPFRRICWLLPI